ncbi:MAG: hypothetical protein NT028_12855, partial [candidate division Zixibacteria bacterium]|nr:hypothetical protein [candidate division Zixibacteria bacterium]
MRQGIPAFIVLLILTTAAYGQLPPPPYAVGFEPTFDAFQIIWHCGDVNVVDYGNDIGVPQLHYVVNPPGTVGSILVEFDGLESYVSVDQISLYLCGGDDFPHDSGDSGSQFVLTIFDHVPSTTHDIAVWGPYVVFAEEVPLSGEWFGFPVHRGLATSGRLFVEFRWQSATPKAPLPALDLLPGDSHTYRGFSSGEQLVWTPEVKGNLLLRLRCNVSDTLRGFEHPTNLPDSFAVFLGADSSTSATTANAYLTVADSLHCTLPRTQTQGMYVTLGTWDSGILSNRSMPLYLDPSAPLAFPLGIEPESLAVAVSRGDTSSTNIVVANTAGRAIRYAILPQSQHVLAWLFWDSAQALILPDESDTLALRISSTVLEVGTHYDTLTVHCESDSFSFRNCIVPMILRVDQATDVDNELLPVISNLVPEQNFPNPFNGSTVIRSSSSLPITVYNIVGRTVATLVITERFASKDYRFNWNGDDQR